MLWNWDDDSGKGADINLYLGALVSVNISSVWPQAGQINLSASSGAKWNSVRS
jgi:hypothetical protein